MEKWNVIDLSLEDVLFAPEMPKYEEWTLEDPITGGAFARDSRELPPILEEIRKVGDSPHSGPSYYSR